MSSKGDEGDDEQINAAPTKAFFVEMLVRDIPLEQAVLDLVDNCIDGVKRQRGDEDYEGFHVTIVLSHQQFRIWDNCGGFSKKTARDYAFRFGRPKKMPATPNSIGQFGVGMKRALFKFGRRFNVRSATKEEVWAIDVNVDTWEKDENDWHFKWADFDDDTEISRKQPGTDIVVDKLRPEVGARFNTTIFQNSIRGLIKSKHRTFISKGLVITVNGDVIDSSQLALYQSKQLSPGVEIRATGQGGQLVRTRIVAGVGTSQPKEAGWYVICNGRVILEADRRRETGWGLIEEREKGVAIPSFHNQFARFRGVVSFQSSDAARLPWNTTKTDVDQDHPLWLQAFEDMVNLMRLTISFLNDLDADIDEYSQKSSPLLAVVTKATLVNVDSLTKKLEFRAPKRGQIPVKTFKAPASERISYVRQTKDINVLKEALDVTSANAVGEKTFDLFLSRQKSR